MTLQELRDSTLSKSIVGLALRVSVVVFSFFLLCFNLLLSLIITFPFLWSAEYYFGDRERAERKEMKQDLPEVVD